MRATDPVLDSDFSFLVSRGIDGVRIFANWRDTLMDNAGNLRPAELDRLKAILTKAKQHGLLVDLSFSCETVPGLDFAHYRDAIGATTNQLAGDAYRHVFFDLQNESTKNSCRGSGAGFETHNDERWALKDASGTR